MPNNFIENYLQHYQKVISHIDKTSLNQAIAQLALLKKQQGRLFILGIGGSAANASHAVNDFRKICGIESYAPTDNVSELTAITNDIGFEHIFCEWLKVSQLKAKDMLMILSVGGGSAKHKVSTNLIYAIDFAKTKGCFILGFTGKEGGYTAKKATITIKAPCFEDNFITPVTESLHAVIWHLIVTHPLLKQQQTTWEMLNANGRTVSATIEN